MIVPREIIRTSRNSLALTLNAEGDLIVKAPLHMPIDNIYKFINEKQSWIEKKQTFIKSILLQNEKILQYEEMFFMGKKYKVEKIKGLDNPYLTKDYLAIPFTTSSRVLQQYIKQFFSENIEKIVLPQINKFAKRIGVCPTSIKIINSKAKWGMCDNKFNIYINYKIAMLSPSLIEYVIVHELCHIKHLNHQKQFWQLVNNVLPEYKEQIKLLKKADFLIKLF